MITPDRAIEILERKRDVIDGLRSSNDSSSSPAFTKWQRDTKIAIEKIFGTSSQHLPEFLSIQYFPAVLTSETSDHEVHKRYLKALDIASSILLSMIDEIRDYGVGSETGRAKKPLDLLENICLRFHTVARQLRVRHADRETLDIEDEYDVQDLLHALLKLHFDDVRPEEWIPSYAGGASRADFLLKQEGIVLEVKKTRKGLKDREAGEQLLVDIARYQAHPDCTSLVCFIYDPEERIDNPIGLEQDLEKTYGKIDVKVIVTPKGR